MRFARVLVPVDFSAHARAAAAVGRRIARQTGGRLTLLHVDTLPELALLSAEPFYIAPQAWELLRRNQSGKLDKEMSDLAAELGPGVESAQTTGQDVVGGILSYADEAGSDLIVIGSHGATATERLLFGSVAAKVSRSAHCPVLVVRPGPAEQVQAGGFKRAMVGIDYSRFSHPAIEAAAALVELGGAIDLLHVWQEPALFAVERSLEHDQHEFTTAVERARAYEVQRMRGFAASCRFDGVETGSWVEVGSPAPVILELAGERGSDLIVVGAHGRHGVFEKVVGTVADRVLRNADVPVLLIPAGALPEPHAAAPA